MGGAKGASAKVAIYFDDLDLEQGDLMRARDAADGFLRKPRAAGEAVALFTSDKMILNFTSAPEKIHEALTGLNGSAHARPRVRECPDISEYQAEELLRDNDTAHSSAWQLAGAEARQCEGGHSDANAPLDGRLVGLIRQKARLVEDEATSRRRRNLQQLDAVTKYLAGLQGERTLLLVSPGFMGGEDQEAVDRIIERALRAQVVVNVLDAKGLSVMMRELDASRSTNVAGDERARAATSVLDGAQEGSQAAVSAEAGGGDGRAILS